MKRKSVVMILSALLCVTTVGACSRPEALSTTDRVRAAQATAGFGPTSGWRLSSASWSKATQAMRDQAYLFCMEKHAGDAACLRAQDYSLIAANHAEINAARFIQEPARESPYERALADRPAGFNDARAYCFSVYQDAGAADARSLGPCLSNAIGADYFNIVPVP